MRNIGIIIVVSCLTRFVSAQVPNWSWANAPTDAYYNNLGIDVATGVSGNTYAVGTFVSPTITFGGTVLINSITDGSSPDIYIVKYDPNGNIIWAKSAGCISGDFPMGIALDENENLYITGWKWGASPMNFETITIPSFSSGGSKIFLAKYDSSGNAIWAKTAIGGGDDKANDIAVDTLGNPYIVGYYSINPITFDTITLPTFGTFGNMFITKFTPDGNVIWAITADSGQGFVPLQIEINTDGNSYIVGLIGNDYDVQLGDTVFDGSYVNPKIVLLKLDNNTSDIIWARKIAQGTTSNSCHARKIDIDTYGNIYVVGVLKGTANFGGVNYSSIAASYDVFVAKCSNNGNVLWTNRFGGTLDDDGNSIAVDSYGNSFCTGSFKSTTCTFGSTTLVNSNSGTSDIFVVNFDGTGNTVWAKRAGASANEVGNGVSLSPINDIYVTGQFASSSIYFGNDTLINVGTSNMYVTKLGSTTVGLEELSKIEKKINIYPNPVTEFVNIQSEITITQMDIITLAGSVLHSFTMHSKTISIPVSYLPDGVYIVKLIDANKNEFYEKIIK